MKISAAQVKKLRETTLAPIMDCKTALLETKGDLEKAKELLRKKGLAHAKGLTDKKASDGLIYSYIHTGGKIGVLVEINSQTDFVARTDEFKNLAKDIAMQIAAMNPSYIVRKDVPEKKMEKFFSQICLLEQPFIKDEKVTVKEYLDSLIAKFKENIVVRRFVRYRLGEE